MGQEQIRRWESGALAHAVTDPFGQGPVPWLRGSETDWRHRVRSNTEIMRFNNYPTKAKLRRIARAAGVEIEFVETDEFMFREGSRVKTAMLKWLRNVKMDRLAVRIAGLVLLQRYMILKARA